MAKHFVIAWVISLYITATIAAAPSLVGGRLR